MSIMARDKPTAIIESSTIADAVSFTTPSYAAENFGVFGKPNAIVRPVRRNESIEEMPPNHNQHTVHQQHIDDLQRQQNQQQQQRSLPLHNRSETVKKVIRVEIDSFTQELDFKLKTLQKHKKHSSKNVNHPKVSIL